MPELPVQTNVPQANATPSRFNWKNVLLGVVIGLILIAVIGITFWYFTKPKESETPVTTTTKTSTPSAKKDETAGWKTTTNDVLGYSIKFPSNWSGVRCNSDSSDHFDEGDYAKGNPETSKVLAGADVCASGARTRITIYRGGSMSYSEVVASWEKNGPTDYSNYKKETITVDGKVGIKVSYVTKENPGLGMEVAGVEHITYVLNDKSNPLTIDYFRYPADELNPAQPDYSNILEKMVSTFKFLD